MSRTNTITLNTIIVFCLFLLFSCKQEVKHVKKSSLRDKIGLAVESRKIPQPNEQKVNFTAPEWIEGRGPHSTEIFRHLEDYLPTVLIEKGTKETKGLPKNISNTLGGEILTSTYFKKETTLDQICAEKQISGVIVLFEGEIIYEDYPDMEDTDRHFLASVSKSFTGTVIANLADEGLLAR